MITRGDRVELFAQTVESMQRNAADWSRHRLLVVFDGTEEERHQWEGQTHQYGLPLFGLVHTGRQVGVGGAKNCGAEHLWVTPDSRRAEVDLYKDLVMFSDSDMYYLPGWDTELTFFMNGPYFTRKGERVTQLGGWRHPFHVKGREVGTNMVDRATVEVDAVTGNCFVMRWADWLTYGPFDANALGPGQSEDFALSRKILAAGGLCATLDPPVAVHCGLVNSLGEPAVGWQSMEEQITTQLGQMAVEDRERIIVARPSVGSGVMAEVAERLNRATEALGIELSERAAQVIFDGRSAQERIHDAVQDMRFRRGSEFTIGIDPAADTSWDGSKYATYGQSRQFVGVNLGSGQRRFDSSQGWCNLDSQSVPPDRVADVVCDFATQPLPFPDNSVDVVVACHLLEHFGCGEALPLVREVRRILKPGGSFIIVVPDMRRLAARWLGGEIDEYTYNVNAYGAFMGSEFDRHKWSLSREGLATLLGQSGLWATMREFDNREIRGSSIPADWWMLSVEAVKLRDEDDE